MTTVELLDPETRQPVGTARAWIRERYPDGPPLDDAAATPAWTLDGLADVPNGGYLLRVPERAELGLVKVAVRQRFMFRREG